jgi:hypothetical protein
LLRASFSGHRAVFDPVYKARLNEHTLKHWPPDEMLGVVALAQHYGIPTRLLDWSHKPLVACYFAAASVAKKPRKLSATRQLAVWGLRKAVVFPDLEFIDGGSVPRFQIVEVPYSSNPNLAAQAGLFTLDRRARVGGRLEESLPAAINAKSDARGLRRIAGLPRFKTPAVFHKLTLPHAEARNLLRLLATEGISAATVFPGLKGVVESLKEQASWGLEEIGPRYGPPPRRR